MLITPIYNGQGLGNQLANYVTTRCLALDKGYQFGVAFPERFKGHFFKEILLPEIKGIEVIIEGQEPISMPDNMKYYCETSSDYDPFIKDIPDNYCIHGNLQGEDYFKHRKDEINKWLEVEPLDMPDDLCVINVRGGEYVGVHDFFLPKEYWNKGIKIMKEINPNMRFEVHTDDIETARKFFPDYKITKDIEINWRSIRCAKYLIISNSSFAWFSAWLGEAKLILAPKFWQRYNRGYWFLEQNKTDKFTYIHHADSSK